MYSIPLSRPHISSLEHQYVHDVLASSRLALGPRLEQFEQLMAAQCQVRHAVAVNSGTAALHLALLGLGLGTSDEVITTPFSFVASTNVLLYENIRFRFVDVDPTTYNLAPDAVARAVSGSTKAVLAVDIFGLPVDWPGMREVSAAHDLFLIDDACHALGATIQDRPIGGWADVSCFGFYPNKQITTGEGGCLTTDSDALAALCRSLRNQGRATDGRMEHVYLGYNYRMNELEAALGCAQMERLEELQALRARVASWYHEALHPLQDDIILPVVPAAAARSWFVYVIRLNDHFSADARDLLMKRLQQRGIGCAPYFPSIHLQPYYRQRFGFRPGDFPVCEKISARTLALPFFSSMAQEDVHTVAAALREALVDLPQEAPAFAVNGSEASSS